MTKELILPFVRHILSVVFGSLIAKGAIDAELSEMLIGFVLTGINIAWMFYDKQKLKAAKVAATTSAALLLAAGLTGCTTFDTHVFRAEQTSVGIAFTAYQGWTNYMAHFPVSPSVSNEVKQARLKFGATVALVDTLRVEYGTNKTVEPQLRAALLTMADHSSNIVWLVNYYKQSKGN